MVDITVYKQRCENIGSRIRDMRKKHNLTQTRLAEEIDRLCNDDDKESFMSQSTVSGWENGTTLPPLSKLIVLASIFDCDVSYLLCDYDEEKKEVSDVSKLTGLSEASLRRIIFEIFMVGELDKLAGRENGIAKTLDVLFSSPSFWKIVKLLDGYTRCVDPSISRAASIAHEFNLLNYNTMSPEMSKDVVGFRLQRTFTDLLNEFDRINKENEDG